jgi:cyclase
MRLFSLPVCLALSVFAQLPALAATPDISSKIESLAPGLDVLIGDDGNVAISHGPDGTIIVDSQTDRLVGQIDAAIGAIGAKPVRYVINTHFHFDHAGGNARFGKTGATIIAHTKVYERLAAGKGGTYPIAPFPVEALPKITFERELTLRLNGELTVAMFTGGGHTDGDSIVFWPKADAVHLGDLFFNLEGYPFVDFKAGGNVVEAIASLDAVLKMIGDKTRVIPSHGPIATKGELQKYRDVLAEVVARVKALKTEGRTLPEIVRMQPLADLNRGGEGALGPDAFLAATFASI